MQYTHQRHIKPGLLELTKIKTKKKGTRNKITFKFFICFT